MCENMKCRLRSSYHEAGHLLIAKTFAIPFIKSDIAAELPEGKDPVTYTDKIDFKDKGDK